MYTILVVCEWKQFLIQNKAVQQKLQRNFNTDFLAPKVSPIIPQSMEDFSQAEN